MVRSAALGGTCTVTKPRFEWFVAFLRVSSATTPTAPTLGGLLGKNTDSASAQIHRQSTWSPAGGYRRHRQPSVFRCRRAVRVVEDADSATLSSRLPARNYAGIPYRPVGSVTFYPRCRLSSSCTAAGWGWGWWLNDADAWAAAMDIT